MSSILHNHLYRRQTPTRHDFVDTGVKLGFSQTLKQSHQLVDSISGITRFVNELGRNDPELVQPVRREMAALEQLHTLHGEALAALSAEKDPPISLPEYLNRLYDFWYNFITAWNHLLTQLEARYCPFTSARNAAAS